MDTKNLEEIIQKIYTIDCNANKCESCKGELEWCPKSYADEVREGLGLINHNKKQCELIIKNKQL